MRMGVGPDAAAFIRRECRETGVITDTRDGCTDAGPHKTRSSVANDGKPTRKPTHATDEPESRPPRGVTGFVGPRGA